MSEETEVKDHNDGTWSGLKKTIIGTLTTVIAGGGIWLSTLLFGGHQEETPVQAPVQQVAPVININNNQQQQNSGGGKTIIIKETAPAVPAEQQKKVEPTKPKKEFTEEEPKW